MIKLITMEEKIIQHTQKNILIIIVLIIIKVLKIFFTIIIHTYKYYTM